MFHNAVTIAMRLMHEKRIVSCSLKDIDRQNICVLFKCQVLLSAINSYECLSHHCSMYGWL